MEQVDDSKVTTEQNGDQYDEDRDEEDDDVDHEEDDDHNNAKQDDDYDREEDDHQSGVDATSEAAPPGEDNDEFMCDNAPVFSTFFQDALDCAASTKGISPKWRRNEDGSWHMVVLPPPVPIESKLLLHKFNPFTIFSQSSMMVGLLGRVLAMSRGDASTSPSSVSEKRTKPRRRQRLQDGGYYLKVPHTAVASRQKSIRRQTPSKSGMLSATSQNQKKPVIRDYRRRLTGDDETIGRLYSQHTGQDLRLRSFHELSHERTERLTQELRSKTCGKSCNQPDVSFSAKNSAKRNRAPKEKPDDENNNPANKINVVASNIDSQTSKTISTVKWHSRDGRRPAPAPEPDSATNVLPVRQAAKPRSGRTSTTTTHSAMDAIFKMSAQNSDSKCKEWIFKHLHFFASSKSF